MNKPNPMAEDDQKINAILAMYANWLQKGGGSDRFRMDDQEALAAINAYTTNKIIDQLEMLSDDLKKKYKKTEEGFLVDRNQAHINAGWNYALREVNDKVDKQIAELKALNHRKDNS